MPTRLLIAPSSKAGRGVAPAQLSGLRSFAQVANRRVRSFVVFQGDRAQALPDGVRASPYAEFLLEELPALAR